MAVLSSEGASRFCHTGLRLFRLLYEAALFLRSSPVALSSYQEHADSIHSASGESMIEKIRENDIPDCVKLIRKSFATVAEQFGITVENAPRFTAFATTEERLLRQFTEECRPMYAFRPAGQWLISSRSPPPSWFSLREGGKEKKERHTTDVICLQGNHSDQRRRALWKGSYSVCRRWQ